MNTSMINFKMNKEKPTEYEKEKAMNDLQREVFINKTLNELTTDLMVCKLLKNLTKRH